MGGDYYDFLNLGRDRVGLVLGDIAGKGIAGALLMANLQANLRSQCSSFDPNVPPVVSGANCTKSTSCGGGENLMFWLLDDASTGALSCEQGAVMRTNPVVQ